MTGASPSAKVGDFDKRGYKELRKLASAKAKAAGLQNGVIGQEGKAADCLAYLDAGTWAVPWGEPVPRQAKAATEPVDGQTLHLFAPAPPGDPPTVTEPDQHPEGPTIAERKQDQGTDADEPPEGVEQDQDAPAAGGVPRMQFSTFPMSKQSKAHLKPLDKKAFLEILSRRAVREKKDGKMFAPATFKGSRSNDNFIAAYGLCLDFDHGQPTVKEALQPFPGTLAAYYSTHSHTPEAPRFRVVVPLSRPVNAEEHVQLVRGVKSIIPPGLMESLDATCFERTRAHYLPSCPPEQERHAFSDNQDGGPLDVEYFLNLGAAVDSAGEAEQKVTVPAPPRSFEFIDPSTGEVIALMAWAAQNPTFDLVAVVGVQYRRGKIKDGKQHIVCPFEDQHTDQGADRATFTANASPPVYPSWEIHCCHAHCADRDRLEFLDAMLKKGWISADQLQMEGPSPPAVERRRPPRVYFPVNDVLAAPEWSALLPDERRIGLDLTVKMWTEDDGTIADDDWMIARHLGVSECEWSAYRTTLTRTKWLVGVAGRLTNALAKREYDSAQDALMKAIIGGGIGGKKSAAKRNGATPP